MKKIALLIINIAFGAMCYSQSFPVAGATWIFNDLNTFMAETIASKWEYEGDSIVPNGVIKKIKVTTKYVFHDWQSEQPNWESGSFKYFLYAGDDTIWDIYDTLSPIADFSLQIGDSAYTGYHSVYSPFYPQVLLDEYNCSQEVRDLFFQKGVVIDVGIETFDGIDSRYYKLEYQNELGETVVRKFTERSILTEGYWYYVNEYIYDCSITDNPNYVFLCYSDNYSPGDSCTDMEWFEQLSVNEYDPIKTLEIYPNPAHKNITIKASVPNSISLKVYGITGNIEIQKSLVKFDMNNEVKLDVSQLNAGIYFVELIAKETRLVSYFVKN